MTPLLKALLRRLSHKRAKLGVCYIGHDFKPTTFQSNQPPEIRTLALTILKCLQDNKTSTVIDIDGVHPLIMEQWNDLPKDMKTLRGDGFIEHFRKITDLHVYWVEHDLRANGLFFMNSMGALIVRAFQIVFTEDPRMQKTPLKTDPLWCFNEPDDDPMRHPLTHDILLVCAATNAFILSDAGHLENTTDKSYLKPPHPRSSIPALKWDAKVREYKTLRLRIGNKVVTNCKDVLREYKGILPYHKVRGHWRNQAIKDGHRQKWIDSHWRGNKDVGTIVKSYTLESEEETA